jgi:hypothetical protein
MIRHLDLKILSKENERFLGRVSDQFPACATLHKRRSTLGSIRPIAAYKLQTIYIKRVLTHAEYDKGEWKNDCS